VILILVFHLQTYSKLHNHSVVTHLTWSLILNQWERDLMWIELMWSETTCQLGQSRIVEILNILKSYKNNKHIT
jgi:hypothetical protein